MSIYLVRHGQDEDNAANILNGRRDTPLTVLGVEQAKETASFFAGKRIIRIYSSPLLRALQTAEIIAKAVGIKDVLIENDLIERDYGVLTGKMRSQIPKYSTDNVEVDGVVYFLNAPKAETFSATYGRAEKFLSRIDNFLVGDVVIVAHRDICIMLRAAHCNWGWEKGLANANMENAGVIKLGS